VTVRTLEPEDYFVEQEPCHEPVGDGIAVFEAACNNQLPVPLGNKGV
jgi:hypothetical protein